MLDKKTEDYNASNELLTDRKKTTRKMYLFVYLIALISLICGGIAMVFDQIVSMIFFLLLSVLSMLVFTLLVHI